MPEPGVDELVEQAEQRRRASAHLRERIANTTGTAVDPRGLIEVTVTGTGRVRGLRLHPAALEGNGNALGRAIVETAHQAAEFARQRCLNQLALVLGDDLAAHLEGVMGVAPARAAGWDTVPAGTGGDNTVPAGTGGNNTVPAGTAPSSQSGRWPGSPVDEPEDDLYSFDPSTLRSDR